MQLLLLAGIIITSLLVVFCLVSEIYMAVRSPHSLDVEEVHTRRVTKELIKAVVLFVYVKDNGTAVSTWFLERSADSLQLAPQYVGGRTISVYDITTTGKMLVSEKELPFTVEQDLWTPSSEEEEGDVLKDLTLRGIMHPNNLFTIIKSGFMKSSLSQMTPIDVRGIGAYLVTLSSSLDRYWVFDFTKRRLSQTQTVEQLMTFVGVNMFRVNVLERVILTPNTRPYLFIPDYTLASINLLSENPPETTNALSDANTVLSHLGMYLFDHTTPNAGDFATLVSTPKLTITAVDLIFREANMGLIPLDRNNTLTQLQMAHEWLKLRETLITSLTPITPQQTVMELENDLRVNMLQTWYDGRDSYFLLSLTTMYKLCLFQLVARLRRMVKLPTDEVTEEMAELALMSYRIMHQFGINETQERTRDIVTEVVTDIAGHLWQIYDLKQENDTVGYVSVSSVNTDDNKASSLTGVVNLQRNIRNDYQKIVRAIRKQQLSLPMGSLKTMKNSAYVRDVVRLLKEFTPLPVLQPDARHDKKMLPLTMTPPPNKSDLRLTGENLALFV
jgi:hypothetical protein